MTTKKKKGKRTNFTDAYKAKIVARVLKGRKAGTETALSVAAAEGISAGNIQNWLKAAGKVNHRSEKANGKPGRRRPEADDLGTITSQLSTAMAEVAKLKKRLRELLAD